VWDTRRIVFNIHGWQHHLHKEATKRNWRAALTTASRIGTPDIWHTGKKQLIHQTREIHIW
jgi:hypothetical protein